MSIAAGDQDLGRMVEELKRELSEAYRREAAMAEVLRVISRAQTDVQPVFETIVPKLQTLAGRALRANVADCGTRADACCFYSNQS